MGRNMEAIYDTEGNIIIPGPPGKAQGSQERESSRHIDVEKKAPIERQKTLSMVKNTTHEGKNQFLHSMHGLTHAVSDLKQGVRISMQSVLTYLLQPVWVPHRNSSSKEYRRGTLFLLDIVRFGGTFAAIFLLLFVTLNYQSFWEITRSKLSDIAFIPLFSDAQDSLLGHDSSVSKGTILQDKLKKIPSLTVAGHTSGHVLRLLPSVGPPGKRIIIPKLGINVPIAIPSSDGLLEENWVKLEEDIQRGLEDGVVHYPGTARPNQPGNFFITGHSSYYPWAKGKYKTIFARLSELEVGDEYWIYYNGEKYRYRIQTKKEVRPTDISVLDQPQGKFTGTLMTCVPVGTTLRRLILSAEALHLQTGEPLTVDEGSKEDLLPQIRPQMLSI